MNSSTHLPKHTISSVAEGLVVNASFSAGDGNLPPTPTSAAAGGDGGSVFTATAVALPPTVVEFDDSLAALWKQLRSTV
jgi:hypothetical protein